MNKETIDDLAYIIDKLRVFPRLFGGFVLYMFYVFHMWFTTNNTISVFDLPEWALVQYAAVLFAVIKFINDYMRTGRKPDDS